MASPLDMVREETGFDLSNPKLLTDVVAPEIADRLQRVIPAFEGARAAIGGMLQLYSGLAAATTAAGAVGLMVGAVVTAKKWLDGQVEAANSDALSNLQHARDKFVERYYGDAYGGGWSSVFRSNGPADPAIKNKVGGMSMADILGQWSPYFMFDLEKVGRNVVAPTWPTPPYDSPALTPGDWCGGVPSPGPSPLTGWGMRAAPPGQKWNVKPGDVGYVAGSAGTFVEGLIKREFYKAPPAMGPLSNCDSFWGNAPGSGTMFENAYDTAIFESGYGIPPNYHYLFSWGTYPYLSWSTASNGLPANGAKYAHSAAAAAIAAALLAPTPIHAAVDARQVAECYRAWLAVTRLRSLPPIPDAQPETGVYLDPEGLPWGPVDTLTLPRNATNTGSEGPYPVPWPVARDIERSFRQFFRVRRALLYDLSRANSATRTAALKSSDPVLQAAAKRGPPPYTAWRSFDPLGDGVWPGGWSGSGGLYPTLDAQKVYPTLDAQKVTPADKASDNIGPTLAAAAGAVGVWMWWRNRKR